MRQAGFFRFDSENWAYDESTKRERLTQLDALLSSEGVDIEAIAEEWGLAPRTVFTYLNHLKHGKGPVVSHLNAHGRRIYKYRAARADEKVPGETVENRERRLQKYRVATLFRIRTLLDKLRKHDEAGADWVLMELVGE